MTSTMLIKHPAQSQHVLEPNHSIFQHLISKFIVQGSYQSKLAIIASHLTYYNTIDFYTDSFLFHSGTTRMTMGIG